MQDVAPAQKLLAVIQRMGQVFGNRVVALYHDVEEPPQSSYLTHVISSCGVSWDYEYFFVTPPLSVNDLRARIEFVFEVLPRTNFIRNSVWTMEKRFLICIEKGGR